MAEINNEDFKIGPKFSRYGLPSAPSVMHVTYDMAGDWLDHRAHPEVAHNRRASKHRVERLAKDMSEGKWKLTHQGLAFDTNGLLIDGQHRLHAVRLSRVTGLDFWIFPDMPRDTFDVMDTGMTRQASQLLGGRNANLITGAARYLMGNEPGEYARLATPQDVLKAVETWPELRTHAQTVHIIQTKCRIPGPPHLAVLAQAERSIFREMIPAWTDALLSGAIGNAHDPRLQLRNRFASITSARKQAMADRAVTYGLIARAWNHHVRGTEVQLLKFRTDEPMIKILGAK